MNEYDMAKAVTRHLSYGVNHLDRSVLERLQTARMNALRAAASAQLVEQWAMPEGVTGALDGVHQSLGRYVWAGVLLLASLMVVDNWQEFNGKPVDDVDATLLSADLPVNAFLDNDFDEWLSDQYAD